MSREDRELRMCYEIVKQAFDEEDLLLGSMNEDWNYLYEQIRLNGWDAISDEEIVMLYDWAEEKDLFKHTTPYCTTR